VPIPHPGLSPVLLGETHSEDGGFPFLTLRAAPTLRLSHPPERPSRWGTALTVKYLLLVVCCQDPKVGTAPKYQKILSLSTPTTGSWATSEMALCNSLSR